MLERLNQIQILTHKDTHIHNSSEGSTVLIENKFKGQLNVASQENNLSVTSNTVSYIMTMYLMLKYEDTTYTHMPNNT